MERETGSFGGSRTGLKVRRRVGVEREAVVASKGEKCRSKPRIDKDWIIGASEDDITGKWCMYIILAANNIIVSCSMKCRLYDSVEEREVMELL